MTEGTAWLVGAWSGSDGHGHLVSSSRAVRHLLAIYNSKPTTTRAPLPATNRPQYANQITAQPGRLGSRSSAPGQGRAGRRGAQSRRPPRRSRCSYVCRQRAPRVLVMGTGVRARVRVRRLIVRRGAVFLCGHRCFAPLGWCAPPVSAPRSGATQSALLLEKNGELAGK